MSSAARRSQRASVGELAISPRLATSPRLAGSESPRLLTSPRGSVRMNSRATAVDATGDGESLFELDDAQARDAGAEPAPAEERAPLVRASSRAATLRERAASSVSLLEASVRAHAPAYERVHGRDVADVRVLLAAVAFENGTCLRERLVDAMREATGAGASELRCSLECAGVASVTLLNARELGASPTGLYTTDEFNRRTLSSMAAHRVIGSIVRDERLTRALLVAAVHALLGAAVVCYYDDEGAERTHRMMHEYARARDTGEPAPACACACVDGACSLRTSGSTLLTDALRTAAYEEAVALDAWLADVWHALVPPCQRAGATPASCSAVDMLLAASADARARFLEQARATHVRWALAWYTRVPLSELAAHLASASGACRLEYVLALAYALVEAEPARLANDVDDVCERSFEARVCLELELAMRSRYWGVVYILLASQGKREPAYMERALAFTAMLRARVHLRLSTQLAYGAARIQAFGAMAELEASERERAEKELAVVVRLSEEYA